MLLIELAYRGLDSQLSYPPGSIPRSTMLYGSLTEESAKVFNLHMARTIL